ncbi:MAG TPA: urease accessory protein UreD [Verrucomicrobiae bacterium]|jgi:urease accessory protein|nr:urease accessory protein UreD [Verrucomicrobiae bacterium]
MTGNAGLSVNVVAGQSAITEAWCYNPIKILAPRPRGPSVWAYLSSFGGGFVAGDQTKLALRVGTGARCFLTTQASTKIYRNPANRSCSHELAAELEADSLLVVAPDPVQPFADSSYRQSQEFHLHSSAGLVLLDWFGSGRAARGERWNFRRLQSRNEVFIDGRRCIRDSILLDGAHGPIGGDHRLGRFNCLGMVLILGNALREQAQLLLKGVESEPVSKRSSLVFSASPVRGGAVLRIAGEQQEEVARYIYKSLGFVGGLLRDDPWVRKLQNN